MYDQNFSSSINDKIDELYNELYESLLRGKKELKHANNKNEFLIDKTNFIEKENCDLNFILKNF